MNQVSTNVRQLVDWSAAVWAGLVAGIVFLLLNVFVVPLFVGGNGWIVLRYIASILLGEGVLPPPASFSLTILVVAFLIHFVLSIGFSLLLAYVIHRWGLLVGLFGGALFGLALYCINFYALTVIFPWFFALRSWPLVVSHLIFGAVAGGVYESLEIEEFVPA